jgi:hypothetical protein
VDVLSVRLGGGTARRERLALALRELFLTFHGSCGGVPLLSRSTRFEFGKQTLSVLVLWVF